MSAEDLKNSINELTLQVQRLSDKVDRIDAIFNSVKSFCIKIATVVVSSGILATISWLVYRLR